jgi:hypothetical protein
VFSFYHICLLLCQSNPNKDRNENWVLRKVVEKSVYFRNDTRLSTFKSVCFAMTSKGSLKNKNKILYYLK